MTVTSRRAWLRQILTLTAGTALAPTLLTRCAEGSEPELPAPEGNEPYATYRMLRDWLRAQPDHYPARVAELTAAGNPETLYRYLHATFITLPTEWEKRSVGRRRYAGHYAALRAGAGTLYEQAEILHRGLTDMGLEAEIRRESVKLSAEDADALFTRNQRDDANADGTDLPAALRERIERVFGSEISPPATPDTASDGLDGRILDALPPDAAAKAMPYETYAQDIPVVVVTRENGERYALPLHTAKAEVEELGDKLPTKYYSAHRLPKIGSLKVELLAHYADDLRRPVNLLNQDYPLDVVAGRHLQIAFDPGVPVEALGIATLNTLTTFRPGLLIRRLPDDPLKTWDNDYTLGEPFTCFKDEVTATEGGVRVNGLDPAQPSDPELLARVTEVRVRPRSLGYPRVDLDVVALDAAGEPVEGLVAADFAITDNGTTIYPALRRNYQEPKVLIQFDYTTSVPAEFRSPHYQEAFEQRIRELVASRYANAKITFKKDLDEYWEQLSEVANDGYDLIICHSDGKVIGELEPAFERGLRQLPPVVFLYVTEDVHPDLDTLAKYINLRPLSVTDAAAVDAAILGALPPANVPPYVFSYLAASEEGGEVPVSVSVNGARGEASYRAEALIQTPLLIGLSAKMTYGRTRTTFSLGGYDPRIHSAVEPHHAEEARDAALSTTYLYCEGFGPSASVVADDVFSGRLTGEDALEGIDQDDLSAASAAVSATVAKHPGALGLLSAVPGCVYAGGLTAPAGPRVCFAQKRLNVTENTMTSRVSLAKSSMWRTLDADPRAAFRRTLAITTRIARLEAGLFPDSTVSRLRGVELVPLVELRDGLRSQEPNYRIYSNIRSDCFDARYAVLGAGQAAYYDVNPSTGEVIAVLPDLTGGGSAAKQLEAKMKKLDTVLNVMIAVLSAGGVSAGGAAVFAFGVVIGKAYLVAATHVHTMDASFDSRCEVYKLLRNSIIDVSVGSVLAVYTPSVGNALSYAAAGGVNTSASQFRSDPCK